MNGLDILNAYSNGELEIVWSGFERLTVGTVELDDVPTKEDRDILRELGWVWDELLTWKFEEWS